jgi:hypothetical protein
MGSQVKPVRQSGQLVVMREMIQVLLLLEQLRLNLASDRHIVRREGQDLVRGQIESMPPDFDVEQTSVLTALPDLEGCARVRIPKLSQQGLAVFGVVCEYLREVEPQELVERKTQGPLQGGIGIQDAEGFGIDYEHAVGRLLKSSPAGIGRGVRRVLGLSSDPWPDP